MVRKAVNLFLLCFLIVASWIGYQAYTDQATRLAVLRGYEVADAVSDRLRAYRAEHGVWPDDVDALLAGARKTAPNHVADVTIVKAGTVKVWFKEPPEIRAGAIVFELFEKARIVYRACQGPGIDNRYLPAECRPGAEPRAYFPR